MPKVTVGIPLYNGMPYIGEAILSVINQTYTDWELIITDDASTDRSAEVVAEFKDPRIRYHRNPRRMALLNNWSRCLMLGNGEYGKLLCQDDLLHPTCLERQVAVLDSNPDITLVTSASRVISGCGIPLARRRMFRRSRAYTIQDVTDRMAWTGTNPIGEPGVGLFRLDTWYRMGACCGTVPYVIDLDLWVRLLRMGRGYYRDEVLFDFRLSPNSLSRDLAREQVAQFTHFFKGLEPTATQLMAGSTLAKLRAKLRQLMYWRC